jgi:hypothetical protein
MHIKSLLTVVCLLLNTWTALAATDNIQLFKPGSYQQILTANANKGFVLAIWSLECSSCIKDMEILAGIHQNRPDLKIIMLSTDEPSASADIQRLLEKYRLTDIENWVFADDNSQKLRYEIDPGWYSEIPRTYFYASNHQREAVSGAMKAEDFHSRFNKLKI